MRLGKQILVIPDCQIKPGVRTDHLEAIGNYIAEKRPDAVVCLGDFADLPSLSSHHSAGHAELEGKRYRDDVASAREAMDRLTKHFRSIRGYRPRLVLTEGNHEYRITRAVQETPKLKGTIDAKDLGYERFGWKVCPFLDVVSIYGIEFSHYFVSGSMGRAVSSAQALLRVRQRSAVMGHVQHTDIAFHPRTGNVGIFAGTCYMHNEDYLGPQANNQRRQIVVLNEVRNGTCDPMFVSLRFLLARYL